MRRAMTPCVHTTTKTASVRHDHSICRLCGLYPRNQVSRLAVLPQTPVKTHNQLLANNVSDALRPDLGAMLAITWYFAVTARVERDRSAISAHRDLAAQHHDAHVEIAVRMEIFGEIRFLTAINHLEPFAPQIALESLSRERPTIAAATGDIGDALGANLFGMQAAGGDFTALPGTECFRVVVARYGDLAAKNEQSGVEVMTMVGFSRVRSQARVDDAKAVAPEVSLEFKTIHRCSPLLMRFAGSKIGQRKCLT